MSILFFSMEPVTNALTLLHNKKQKKLTSGVDNRSKLCYLSISNHYYYYLRVITDTNLKTKNLKYEKRKGELR